MNDFGTFSVVSRLVREDEYLSSKGIQVITEVDEDHEPPYAKLMFGNMVVNYPFQVSSALVTCDVQIASTYHGVKELHLIMERLNTLLDGCEETVEVSGLLGTATFKQLEHKITQKADSDKRFGQMSYQVKINLRRED